MIINELQHFCNKGQDCIVMKILTFQLIKITFQKEK